MVPRTEGKGSEEIAAVDPTRCVSCGICAGSCEQLAIGPGVRSGHAQIRLVKQVEGNTPSEGIAFVTCRQGDIDANLLPELSAGSSSVVYFAADCVGSLHSLTVERLASHYRGVFLLSCPTRRCTAREGVFTAAGRFFHGRDPAPAKGLDASRVRLVAGARAERAEIRAAFREFQDGVGEKSIPGLFVAGRRRGATRVAVATIVTALLLAGVAAFSSVPWGAAATDSALRLAWRLPGQSYEDCRPLSEKEIAALPVHMRRTEDCVRIYLKYRLAVWLDGIQVLEEEVQPLGARGDRPLYVERDLPLDPGTHTLRVDFEPVEDPSGKGIRLDYHGQIRAQANRAILMTVAGEPARFEITIP